MAGRERRGPRGGEGGKKDKHWENGLGEEAMRRARGGKDFNFYSHSQMCWRQNVAFEELVAR